MASPKAGLGVFPGKSIGVDAIVETNFYFDVDIRDYNLWIDEDGPVILILFDATRNESILALCAGVFHCRPDSFAQKKVRGPFVCNVPGHQVLDRHAVKTFRGLKARFEKPKLRII